MTQALGPVEYLIFYFEGNQFRGEILPALTDLLDKGLVRIIDLAVVSKDGEGTVTILEANELQAEVAEALIKLEGELTGLLSEEDLLMVAEELDNNTTAAALLFEHVWATAFAQAIRNANGQLLMNVRIPNDVMEEVRDSILAAAA
ncbi:MAG: hypothetical protein KJZ93_00500 [Caldilineaceae bacterium]|nr:hypothetical protein [Caldilineaceae bacterium]